MSQLSGGSSSGRSGAGGKTTSGAAGNSGAAGTSLKPRELTPRELVAELDRYIVGQAEAKRAVAIAVRNRWRRQRLTDDMRHEVSPKNILMIGPTGVGKTEIARRLAKLTGAPFIKVEATKYTEVGYYGRDVESMVRDLVENAIGIVRTAERANVEQEARKRATERLLDLLQSNGDSAGRSENSGPGSSGASPVTPLFPRGLFMGGLGGFGGDFSSGLAGGGAPTVATEPSGGATSASGTSGGGSPSSGAAGSGGSSGGDGFRGGPGDLSREKLRSMLEAGELEQRRVELRIEQKMAPVMVGGMGMEQMDIGLQGMFEKILPKNSSRRTVTVAEAREILFEQEVDALLDPEKINAQAVELAENVGIIFIDEIDKVVAAEGKGADVSRQGVQRDLLPIVEGTTVQTRYGYVRTDHVLFVAAGAFHKNKPSDLMPELQGRFPIRVELKDLTKDDFIRILTEPKNSLTRQYAALLGTEGVTLEFTEDAIDALAAFAFQVNQSTQNIGARRLYTILERLLEDLSFAAAEMGMGHVVINAAYVSQKL
ncbi:MAG TPA: ATP-dependent protease ATPase subunit HslU, partial [Pirellulaceae bacterium]|nr:ATP-dependent protease ATPase subunit HslU [Pirellulaceae bacterium]